MQAIKRNFKSGGGSGANMEELSELYYGSIEEREALANAINDKGIETNITDSLIEMAEHVTHIYEGGDALAEHITIGHSAWVNGVLVEGTRPLPITQISGAQECYVSSGSTATHTIRFPIKFLEKPAVTVKSSYEKVSASVSSIGLETFNVYLSSSSSTGQSPTISWTAAGKTEAQ